VTTNWNYVLSGDNKLELRTVRLQQIGITYCQVTTNWNYVLSGYNKLELRTIRWQQINKTPREVNYKIC